MSLPLKIFLSLTGLVFTTIIGAVIYITAVFDPNDYRDEISQAAQKATGRELTIAGDIDLNLFPWIGVEVTQVALSNAKTYGPAPMLEVGQLQARLELMPLLTEKAVRIGEVRLQDVVVRAAVRGEGNNWEDIAAHQAAQQSEKPATEPAATEDDTTITVEASNKDGEPLDIAIAGITLLNIRLEYDADGELTTLQLDRLQTGPIRLGDPSTLLVEVSASLPEGLTAQLELTSGWKVEPQGPIAELDNLQLTTTISGPTVPGGAQTITAKGSARYDGAAGTVKVPGIALTIDDLAATITADIALAETGPRGEVGLNTTPFIAQDIAAKLGIPLGNDEAKQPTALNLVLALGPDSLRSKSFKGTLDGAPLKGSFSVENFANPRIRANFELAAFILEHWAPPATAEASSSQDDSAADPMTTELPLHLVKDLDLDVTAVIGSFKGSGITAKNVTWTAFSRPGQPFRQELVMQAYGGEIRAKTNIDARGAKPKTGLVLDMQAVGLGDLLKGTVGESYVTGLTQLSLNVDTAGNTIKSMLSAAVGAAQYSLKDGSVEGFSLLDLINTSATKLQGGTAKASGETSTGFQELAGKLVFSGGRANAQQLNAGNDLMSLTGKGGIDLENLKWDLNLSPRLKDHPSIRGQRQLKNLIGIDIPLRVSGPLMAPKLKLDIEDALKARAKQEIDEKKDELKAKAEDKVEKELGRQLEKLFGKQEKKPSTDSKDE